MTSGLEFKPINKQVPNPALAGRTPGGAGSSKPATAAVARLPSPLRLAAADGQPGGPVADLEARVAGDWWRTLFDDLYLKTDRDVFENAQNTRADVDALVALAGLRPADRVLDLCCGQGRHAIELAKRGFANVVGVDQSKYLIELARRRADSARLSVRFIEGDARTTRLDGFDCVAILGNSFGYFESAGDDAALLQHALGLLEPGGRLVLDLVDGEWLRGSFAKKSWEWLDDGLLVCRERTMDRAGDRLVTREVILQGRRGVVADRFFAERLYGRGQIVALLEQVGFDDIRIADAPRAQSDTAADLGMMAQRLIVTARHPTRGTSRQVQKTRELLVVMGDPRLTDTVKPDRRFDEDDLRTIHVLREALAELTQYRVRVVDEHATLLSVLQTARPDLVMNLCDEGFRNDPAMEAHVPALLDVLGLPYTGAGPACLVTCYDKSLVRAVALSLGIPVPQEIVVGADDPLNRAPALVPALVKPCLGDNSVGIDHRSVVRTGPEAVAALRRLRDLHPGRPALIQEFLGGAEYSVALIGNPGRPFEVLPVLEVDYSALDSELPHILAYSSKWEPQSPYARKIRYKSALLTDVLRRRMVDQATRLFARLGCRDYARFDFRTDTAGQVKLLEVNPNPGWCHDGKLNIMASFAGMTYPDLLGRILTAAENRLASCDGPAAPALVNGAAHATASRQPRPAASHRASG